ncbi:MAG: hypothetical protein J6127_02625 [Clostridiales bacterium]|nr:hypothetical protein [Clostridiales bacterium]
MKDFDIHVKGATKVTLFGTDNDTICVPSFAKIDTDRSKGDIDINVEGEVCLGIPSDSEHIELGVKDAKIILTNLHFENLEIDAKGSVTIDADDISGKLDINLADSVADLNLPSDFSFRTKTEGKNNRLNNDRTEDQASANIIEFNGKNSVLNIR